jgi:molybdopterin-synthase adenylyltransferase
LEADVTSENGRKGLAEIPERYSRQVLFPGIGRKGQARILASKVVLVGCGALGSFQASLLTRAGVGLLRIIDRDFVEESNLQRQILFDEEDARAVLPKAIAAKRKLLAANSLVAVEGIVEDVTASNIERLLAGFDLIVDATDNFDIRFLLNDYAVRTSAPWIYGACVGSYGITFPILPGETACLRCVIEEPPPAGLSPSCDTAGIIGPIAAIIASFQASEALKILCGRKDLVVRRITSFDLWTNQRDAISLPARQPDCPCCGLHDFPYLEGKLGADAAVLCGRNSVQVRRHDDSHFNLENVARKLSALGTFQNNKFLLRATVDKCQLTVFADGRAIISGTDNVALAKSLYARYVGS